MPGVLKLNLSRGPALTKTDKGVHIIFIDGPGPVPRSLPPDEDLDAIARELDKAQKKTKQAAPAPIEKTDVIVYTGRPLHKVKGHLMKHPEVHKLDKQTVLKLKVERDRAVWWSEEDFKIDKIERVTEHKTHGADHESVTERKATDEAKNPTVPEQPFKSLPKTESGLDVDERMKIYWARSDTPLKEAKGHEYKITFSRRDGPSIDPNMRCT